MRWIASFPRWVRVSLYGLIPYVFLTAVCAVGLIIFKVSAEFAPRLNSLAYGFGFFFGGAGVALWLSFWFDYKERIRQLLIEGK